MAKAGTPAAYGKSNVFCALCRGGPTVRRAGRSPPVSAAARVYSPGRTDTSSVAVSSGLIGPIDCRTRGPSIVTVWDAPDWFATSIVIGPAPNLAGDTVTFRAPSWTET